MRIPFNSSYNFKEDISLYFNDIRDQENNDGTIECGKIDLDQSMHYTIGVMMINKKCQYIMKHLAS